MPKIIKKVSLIVSLTAIIIVIGNGLYEIIKLNMSNKDMVRINSDDLLRKEYRSE